MKATIQVLGAALLLIALAACQGAYLMEIIQEQGEARTAKAITAFSFVSPAATGTINENTKTIAVTVPYGTNVTALVATFTTAGSSVKVGSTVQVSGTTANNFTNPVIYTVTDTNGRWASYTVTVTVTVTVNPSGKVITAFSFVSPAATGTINENTKTIAVTVPYGTNLKALVATFTATGSRVMVGATVQVSGMTANNFTNPVIYTATAADGSTVSYMVTVTTVPRSRIVAEYLFSGNAADTSGNGHHGIVHGATLTSDRFGNTNSAYSFDGVDDYIEVPFSVDPNIDSFSFHSFALLDVVGKHFEGFHLGNNGGEIGYGETDMNIGFGIKLCDGLWHSTSKKVVESGRWYSIACVYVKGSKVRLFVDGVLIDEQGAPNLSMFVYPPLKSTIGCVNYSYAGGCQFYWQGKIDDFRFYRSALTDTEIGELFHEGGLAGN